ERGEIVRALLEPRQDRHEALLHRALHLLAPPHRALTRKTGGQKLADRRVVLARELASLGELAVLDDRLHPVPPRLVLLAHERQRDEAHDRDREAERHHENDGIHERSTVLEEVHYRIPGFHVRSSFLALPLASDTKSYLVASAFLRSK